MEGAIPLLVALGGGAGIGAGLKALIDTLLALRAGVSAREGRRKADIAEQRDEALKRLEAERGKTTAALEVAHLERVRAEWATRMAQTAVRNSQRAREHAAELRILLMERANLTRAELPEWPKMEETEPSPRTSS